MAVPRFYTGNGDLNRDLLASTASTSTHWTIISSASQFSFLFWNSHLATGDCGFSSLHLWSDRVPYLALKCWTLNPGLQAEWTPYQQNYPVPNLPLDSDLFSWNFSCIISVPLPPAVSTLRTFSVLIYTFSTAFQSKRLLTTPKCFFPNC